MYAGKLILIGCLCFVGMNKAQAQVSALRQGAVLVYGKGIRVDSVLILNKRSNGRVWSNRMGLFSIMAAKGDTLELSAKGFEYLTISVIDTLKLLYYLKSYAGTELNTVFIAGNSTRKNLLEAQKAYRSKGVFYTGPPHYYYLFLKPMTFIYENFKGEVRQARHFKKMAKGELAYYDISLRFNDRVIKNNIPIKDEELDAFKMQYWPAIAQIKVWSDYEVIAYIKKSFEEFKQKESAKQH